MTDRISNGPIQCQHPHTMSVFANQIKRTLVEIFQVQIKFSKCNLCFSLDCNVRDKLVQLFQICATNVEDWWRSYFNECTTSDFCLFYYFIITPYWANSNNCSRNPQKILKKSKPFQEEIKMLKSDGAFLLTGAQNPITAFLITS